MKYLFWLMISLISTATAIPQDSVGVIVEITFTRTAGTITAINDLDSSKIAFLFNEIHKTNGQILNRDRLLIAGDTLFVANDSIDLSSLSPTDIIASGDGFKVTLTRPEEQRRSRRATERNRFASFRKLVIPEKDFVRGNTFCIGAETVIDGEINGNVVALFADVRLEATAVCQRDVVSIGGDIRKHRLAQIKGTYQSTDSWQQSKVRHKRKAKTDQSVVSFGAGATYNRVDGLAVTPTLTFRSEEKFLPKFFFSYGYGLASKRSKYQLGIEQKLFDHDQTKIGGSVYRQTKTEDEWICESRENTIYALLIREDYRDYYEGEGGELFVEQNLAFVHTLRAEYSFETLSWLPTHTGLWSLFGGKKRFRGNFSSVAESCRNTRLEDYSKDEAVLKASYVLNTVEDERGKLARAGWVFGAHYEHSSIRLGSDFDFDRYLFELRRYQPLTYIQNLNLRLTYGGATGKLPLHRLFYLGGIRTLRGFDIKEFSGNRMALANAEYVVDFPKTDVGLALLFDMGKTGWDADFLKQGAWRGDIGIGVRFSNWIRVELTRQINGDGKMQLSALMGKSF